MGLTKVSYSMIDGAPVNVKDFGAVGDGITDDTAAIQAAINAVAAQTLLGGTVYLPYGLYYVTAPLELASPNITIIGDGTGVNHNSGGSTTQDGSTQIIGGHTTGPVIRIKHWGCQIRQLAISSNTTRRAATSGTNVYGIWAEAVDTSIANSNASPWRTTIDHVHVTKQPSHGIVMIGNVVMSAITYSDIDNVNGHGVVIDNGTITNRTNKFRPGQVNLNSIRSSRTDGCAFLIGAAPYTIGTTGNLVYRIDANMLECFYNLQDPATYNASGKMGSISGFMENCVFQSCATGGYLAPATGYNGIYILGQTNAVINHRFINCEPYCAYIDDFGSSYRTADIKFEVIHVSNGNQSPGYYDPAIYTASPEIRNISVYADTYAGIVTSMLDTKASLYPVLHYRRDHTFVGNTTSNFNSWSQFTLADDQAGYFTLDSVRSRSGMLSLAGTSSNNAGIVTYRVGDGLAHCTKIAGTAGFDVTTGPLTGTTGVNGNFTVSADTTNRRIYVENRQGGTVTYDISNICSTGIINNFTLV